MFSFPEPVAISFDDSAMSVALDDGRTITVPLAWYPALLHASPKQRSEYWLSPGGVHWDALDEDISVEGMFGARRQTNDIRHAA